MIRSILLILLVFVTNLSLEAQQIKKLIKQEAILKPSELIISKPSTSKPIKGTNQKSPGASLFTEDFANQMPTGWTVINNGGNNCNFKWANSAPGGQYSVNIPAINSTSGSNGFIAFTPDLCNTPFPPGGPTAFDVRLNIPAISIGMNPAVTLSFEQSYRYCCSASNVIGVEVSNDSINWTSYDAKLGRSPSTSVPGNPADPAERIEFNVSSVLANQSTAYLRFTWVGGSHYYWMIDDLELSVGFDNQISLDTALIQYTDTSINPVMTQIPYFVLDDLDFYASFINEGYNVQNGIQFNLDVYHDSSLSGASGHGLIHHDSIALGIPLPPGMNSSLWIRNFQFIQTAYIGHLRMEFNIESDSVHCDSSLAMKTKNLILSDTVLAKDLPPYLGDAGPSNYVGGGNDGDRWASLVSVGDNPVYNSQIICNSLSIHVANVSTNVGARIQPRIWYWNDTASTIAGALGSNPIGSSPFSTLIDSSMLGNWIRIPIFPPASIQRNSQYAVGWEQTGGAANGAEFTASRDQTNELAQPNVSNFIYVNDANPAWGWVTQLAAVRMNIQMYSGLIEGNTTANNFNVFPNPNRGSFKIQLDEKDEFNKIEIRNALGALLMQKLIKGSEKQIQLDLGDQEAGIYFVSLIGASGRNTQKIVVQ